MTARHAFAAAIVRWQAQSGRHDLPWQGTRDPYRIWLSEVMLQQTQVRTVIPYYRRFLDCFPDVAALAAAPVERVMERWSGLGYYSRARNLHRCAQSVVGAFPTRPQRLPNCPGSDPPRLRRSPRLRSASARRFSMAT
jgi:A/G-specific adenine glycosylase